MRQVLGSPSGISSPNLIYFDLSGLTLGAKSTLEPYSNSSSFVYSNSLYSGHQRDLLCALLISLVCCIKKVQKYKPSEDTLSLCSKCACTRHQRGHRVLEGVYWIKKRRSLDAIIFSVKDSSDKGVFF